MILDNDDILFSIKVPNTFVYNNWMLKKVIAYMYLFYTCMCILNKQF